MRKSPFISWKTEMPAIVLLGCVAVASALARGFLPEQVATHWNIAGDVDGWSSRAFVVWFFPLITLGVYLLMLSVWRLDPKRDRYNEFRTAYHVTKTMLVAFFSILYAVVLSNGLGYAISVSFATMILIGLLFIGFGIILPLIRQNWFFGIRTPWTLSSEKVWDKTHRVGGLCFAGGGFLVLVSTFLFPEYMQISFFFLVAAALYPVIYSYFAYRRGH